MNFDICTKDYFVSYKQEWLLKTSTMNISRDAIKVVQHSKEWLRWSLFHYWNVCIYTDSDLNKEWKKNLELSYIPDPKRLVKKIKLIMWNPWENLSKA